MAQQNFNVSLPNDGLGDALRNAFVKQQDMNTELYDTKVDKVTGMGLSTNDYTNDEKTKLEGIEAGAEVNVPADWLTILNAPDLNSIAAFPDTRFGYTDSNSFELPENVQALSVRKNGEPTDVNINNWTQTANIVTYIGTLVSGDYLIISGVYVILSTTGGGTPTNYPAKTILVNPLEYSAPPTFLENDEIRDFLEISDLLANNTGVNSGDETTATIQAKRPIKTVNGESLEGSGNITISGGGAVDSVNGQVGVVVLDASDVGAPNGSGNSTGNNTGDQDLTPYLLIANVATVVLATLVGTLSSVVGAVLPTDSILIAISRLNNTLAELLGRTIGTNSGDNAPNTNSNAYADSLLGPRFLAVNGNYTLQQSDNRRYIELQGNNRVLTIPTGLTGNYDITVDFSGTGGTIVDATGTMYGDNVGWAVTPNNFRTSQNGVLYFIRNTVDGRIRTKGDYI